MFLKQLGKLFCLIFQLHSNIGLMRYLHSKLKKLMASEAYQSHSKVHHPPGEKHYYEWVFHRPHIQNRKHAKFVSKH